MLSRYEFVKKRRFSAKEKIRIAFIRKLPTTSDNTFKYLM